MGESYILSRTIILGRSVVRERAVYVRDQDRNLVELSVYENQES